MTGTYVGTWHGGNDFTGEPLSSVQNQLRANALSKGSLTPFLWSETSPLRLQVGNQGNGNGAASGGPGVARAGSPSGSGPGVGAVSSAREGASVGGGPGSFLAGNSWWDRAISLNWGGKQLPLADPDKNVVTETTYFGIPTVAHRGFSDAQTNENRYGDSEVWSTIDGTLIRGADAWNTWSTKGVPFVKQQVTKGWGLDVLGDGSVYVGDPKLDPMKGKVDRGAAIDWLGDGKYVTKLW